eukprot:3422489-Prymnesium_polylepis.2
MRFVRRTKYILTASVGHCGIGQRGMRTCARALTIVKRSVRSWMGSGPFWAVACRLSASRAPSPQPRSESRHARVAAGGTGSAVRAGGPVVDIRVRGGAGVPNGWDAPD